MSLLRISLALALAAALNSCTVPGQTGFGASVQGTGDVEALERQAPVPDAPDVREGQAARAAAYYSNGNSGYGHSGYGGGSYPSHGSRNSGRYW